MTEQTANAENGRAPVIRTVRAAQAVHDRGGGDDRLGQREPRNRRRRICRHYGAVGLRQVNAAQFARLARQPDRGGILAAGRGGSDLLGAPAGKSAQGDPRLCLSVVQSDQRIDRPRERRVAPALHGYAGYGAQAASAVDPRPHADHPPREAPFRSSFPAASSSAWPWRGPWSREPKLVLADEPTGNLDSRHGDEVMEMLTEMNRNGTTVVMVTHSPAYADFAHRIIHLFDGKIVSENIERDQEAS